MAIHFIDSDKIDITFNLIINVSSLNKYGLSVNDFPWKQSVGKTEWEALGHDWNEWAWNSQKIIDTI
jgi:hypothetical protein